MSTHAGLGQPQKTSLGKKAPLKHDPFSKGGGGGQYLPEHLSFGQFSALGKRAPRADPFAAGSSGQHLTG